MKKSADFQRAYSVRRHAADGVLVIHAAENGTATTRLGLSVSRAVGNAVVRNRWKRWIREAFRRVHAQLPTGLDLIVRPRRGAGGSQAEVQQSLLQLALRLHRQLAAPPRGRGRANSSSAPVPETKRNPVP